MIDKVKSKEIGPDEFNREYYQEEQPVLIKEEVIEWEATQEWSPEFLDCILGNQETHVNFHEEGYFNPNDQERLKELTLPFSEACRNICEDGRYYLAQTSIKCPWITRLARGEGAYFPKLQEYIHQPRFLDDPSKSFRIANVWFGGDQCKTWLHYDLSENFFSNMVGEKRFLLFSPTQTDYLYQAHGESHNHLSRVNAFDPDTSKFPRYNNADYFDITVEPGDMLFIPSGWWHAVDTITTSISVNFWWNDFFEYMNNMASMFGQRVQSEVADFT